MTSNVNRGGLCFPLIPFSNSKSDNVLFTCPNKFSIGENSGELAGVKSKFTLGYCFTISIIRDDLWAQRLSRTNTNFFDLYFSSMAIIRALKYDLKVSFQVPPS